MPDEIVIPIVQPRACGAGRGEQCCAYLMFGGSGFQCGREDKALKEMVEERVSEGLFTAKRLPSAPRPICQIFTATG